MGKWSDHVSSARARLAEEGADAAQYLLRHGTMRAGLYAPKVDDQHPHSQDELYIVASGQARFSRAGELLDVRAGHFVFVPARTAHRFEAMSDDFATYVVFWGPVDGEAEQ
ncbi:MAG TPA: cupin domain-containing protein [Sphingomicrobium sp.]|nr:cupin domain-containing protein [Sphingomicrobium sp.]